MTFVDPAPVVARALRSDLGCHEALAPAPQPKLLVVVEQREFVRGCLAFWIGGFGQEFTVTSMADIETSLRPDLLSSASAVILGAGARNAEQSWLLSQFAWLRENAANVPVVVIAEPHEIRAVQALSGRLCFRGYIPTSSSMEVAAAALRLIIAGGTYMPPRSEEKQEETPGHGAGILLNPTLDAVLPARLTSREKAVLELIERGLPNKMIGFKLSMSQSTVKVHVHNIITKLNVRNRTEAAVARYAR